MKTILFVPKVCRGDDATFEGSIEIKPMGIEEKLNLYSDQGVDAEAGEDGEIHVKRGKGNVSFLIAAIRLSKGNYVAVDLKHKATGTEFKSYDDLNGDTELGHPIITDVATAMLSGFKVGNG